jgi:DNA-binding CsgD family transcriptional regulator
MGSPLLRHAEWLDLAATLCASPSEAFPRAVLADELAATFPASISWNWLDSDGTYGFEMREPIPGFPSDEEAHRWSREGITSHPVLRWYALTGDTQPMTVARVPREVASAGFGLIHELLAPRELEQQLSIPYRFGTEAHRAFVLARGGDDFTDQEVATARLVQPLIAMLERQATAIERSGTHPDRLGLTARELAVLQLLREGLTSGAIAHRLLISPRTVHSHLRNLYRKLGVIDRMQAVLVAQQLGLLSVPTACRSQGTHLASRWVSRIPIPADSVVLQR